MDPRVDVSILLAFESTRLVGRCAVAEKSRSLLFVLTPTQTHSSPAFATSPLLKRIDVLEEIAGLDASYLHAKQEDHEDLKKNIREEFKKHKKEKQERALRSTMMNTLEAGSSLEGQSVAISASSGHDGARSGSSEFRSISESSRQQKKDEPQLEQKQPKEL